MAGNEAQPNNIYSANDALDINELASLNDDITPEMIERLQSQVAQNAMAFTGKNLEETSDADLFEEISETPQKPEPKSEEKDFAPERVNIDENIDDNFIKKYKAKLNKEQQTSEDDKIAHQRISDDSTSEETVSAENSTSEKIENLTSGNIIERPIAQEQIEYNDSLDFLDENVKYSKYVIYIDPENSDFIESLTVKERKNLINRILREQDDIAITKKRLSLLNTIIKHSIIAIVTIAISVPVLYNIVNASFEASINNYRRSQAAFKTLYKEKGKIKQIKKY